MASAGPRKSEHLLTALEGAFALFIGEVQKLAGHEPRAGDGSFTALADGVSLARMLVVRCQQITRRLAPNHTHSRAHTRRALAAQHFTERCARAQFCDEEGFDLDACTRAANDASHKEKDLRQMVRFVSARATGASRTLSRTAQVLQLQAYFDKRGLKLPFRAELPAILKGDRCSCWPRPPRLTQPLPEPSSCTSSRAACWPSSTRHRRKRLSRASTPWSPT
jgi:hypothetical protein